MNFIQRDSGAQYDSPVADDVGITGLLETFSPREVFSACDKSRIFS